ncbi:MAG: hypothetical protein ACOYMD_16340, partial [Paludibacter sp.]
SEYGCIVLCCKGMRESGTEWSGCTKAVSAMRRALEPILRLADYNVMGGLNAVCKKIQCMDTKHEKGKRNVLVTENQHFLTDFDFNKTNPFNRVIRVQPTWQINRETVSATVTIPEFNPTEHLVSPNKLPFMRFVILLGVTTNVRYDENSKSYAPDNQQLLGYRKETHTAWNPVKRALPEQTLEVQIENIATYLTDNDTLLLAVGVEFGTVGADGEGEAVKWAGCGKMVGS